MWTPVAAVRRLLAQPPVPGGYLTLSTVDADRREVQIGRQESGTGPVQDWMVRTVRSHMEVAAEARFRLRRWRAGGKPDGSVTFVVSRPAAATAAPAVPTIREDNLVRRLAAIEAGAAASHERVVRLEARLAAAERLIELMKPIVAASEQALLIIGGADDADT